MATLTRPQGRPSVMTPENIAKLEEVFALGGTDKEACGYAGISIQALYDYQNRNPSFTERKEFLKDNPVLKARRTVIDDLDDTDTAKWYLEKRSPDFNPKTQHQHLHVEVPLSVEERDRVKQLFSGE